MKSDRISEREIRHREIVRKIAADGIVFLKNENVLPLRKDKALSRRPLTERL